MNIFLFEKLKELEVLFKKYHVKRAYVFGSVLGDRFSDSSDIDILLSMEDKLEPIDAGENYIALWDELEDFLKRKVDILTEGKLRNKVLLEEIDNTKELIYGSKS